MSLFLIAPAKAPNSTLASSWNKNWKQGFVYSMDCITHLCLAASKLLGQICRMLPLVFMIAILDYSTAVPDNGRPLHGFHGRSFSLYVLSRGKGVPDASWRALEEMRELFASRQADGVVVRVHETRIGLEGERRLCAEFIDEAAAREAWCRAKEIVAGVELVNLRAEPCSP